MSVQFYPLEDFSDSDLQSSYCVGFTYTLREGNELLEQKVNEWLKAGKVALDNPQNSKTVARLQGTGQVKD